MQSESPHKNKGAELDLILARWENRYEMRQLSRTVPRSLIAAALLGLVACAVGYLRLGWQPEQLALICSGLLGLGFVLNLVRTLLFPPHPGAAGAPFRSRIRPAGAPLDRAGIAVGTHCHAPGD